jgi:AcrR family transcriptional regulator
MPIEQRREQLLDATIRIIARDGYDAVSIDAIARECGVTRPVVYSAYDGLGPLLHALLDRSQARAMTAIAEIFADPPGPDFVAVATRRLIETVRADQDIWRPILGLTENSPHEVRDRVEGDRSWIRGQIATLLPSTPDPEVTAHLVVAAVEHVGRLALAGDYDTDRLVRAVESLFGGVWG